MKPNKKINFCGAVDDTSGYGEFSRYFVGSLIENGEQVSVDKILLDPKNLDFGKKGSICKERVGKNVGAYVNVVNMVPPLFKKHKKPGCLNIGFTMWEASKLPSLWVKLCNEMDAIFVPCKYNEKVFKESGVIKPIYVVQPGVDTFETPEVFHTEKPQYTFYSIFQWLERKNPESLLKAYFSAFAGHDDVNLVLKTYLPKVPNQHNFIIEQIEKVKASMRMPDGKYPKVTPITQRLSSGEMNILHASSDCFVLPHSSEGWGMPHMEAMWHGNPVISTGYSGNMDFMNNENSFLVNYGLKPVTNMHHYGVPWFDATMWWADPHIHEVAERMRYVYENRSEARSIAMKGREDITSNFNFSSSSAQFMSAVEDLVRGR